MADVECVLDIGAELGECPVWCRRSERLYWTDIRGRTLNRFDPQTRVNEQCAVEIEVGSFALRENGGLLVATRDGLGFLDFDTGVLDLRADPEAHRPANRFNDGRADPKGRFVGGTMADPYLTGERAGTLYSVAPDLTSRPICSDIGISNGLAFSPDGASMYFADTPQDTIWVFDYEPSTGIAANQRTFASTATFAGRPRRGLCR